MPELKEKRCRYCGMTIAASDYEHERNCQERARAKTKIYPLFKRAKN